jgi:hypothetical protein
MSISSTPEENKPEREGKPLSGIEQSFTEESTPTAWLYPLAGVLANVEIGSKLMGLEKPTADAPPDMARAAHEIALAAGPITGKFPRDEAVEATLSATVEIGLSEVASSSVATWATAVMGTRVFADVGIDK